MIVYSATKAQFHEDVLTNGIEDIIYDTYKAATGRSTSRLEIQSWKNSLPYMDRVLTGNEIPDDSGVAIEYHIPRTTKRIDFILTGKDHVSQDTAILIELKQWEAASLTGMDAMVETRFSHGVKETLHPSYQAWSYKTVLEDYSQTVNDEHIQLYPCAYLHNYMPDDVIMNDFYSVHIGRAPVFLKPDAVRLREFIKQHIKYGDADNVMYRIDHGRIRPSKNLADELQSMLQGNQEFVLIDEQKAVYETALALAKRAQLGKKQVLIVEGGPGTGKSVVAINLLVELTNRDNVAQYVTRNSAPRKVYEAKLTGSMTLSRISNMFSGSGSYHSVDPDTYDALVVDEAHRLNAKSGMFNNLGENQIKEIINATKSSVFFIDEDQKVTLQDIGDKDEICRWAKQLDARVTKMELTSQFRCNGSNGYLAWVDDVLQIRETANETLEDIDYDFQVFESPKLLHDTIIEKNKTNNKSRLVAGYCWRWVSKRNPLVKDIIIGDYAAQWNLNSQGQAWIIHPDSVSEVGVIHTCQGLEADYIGVIVGPDLIVRDGRVITDASKRASSDKSVFGYKKLMKEDPEATKARLDRIIKNTYRALMTRGQKGCYIYCTDSETAEYFRRRMISIEHKTEVGALD